MGESADGDGVRSADAGVDGASGDRGGVAESGPAADADESGDPQVSVGRPVQAPPSDTAFGWRGWVLVGMIVVSFIVIPWTLIFVRDANTFLGSLGLSLTDVYFALPMIPAIGLAVVAVWAAVRTRT